MFTTLLLNLCVVQVALVILWRISIRLRDVSIVDPFWGFGFVLLAWTTLVTRSPGWDARSGLLCGLTTVWGIRLSLHLLVRKLGHAEDFRYRAMRDKQGPRFWWLSLFTVFLLQGLIMWLIAMVVVVPIALSLSGPLTALDGLGVVVWSVGLFFESVGDWQLQRFQRDPTNRGKVLNRGLWRYTRHPNYFGDFCVWWGLYLISIGGGGVWTVFGPLLMSVLLMKFSGVTLLEKGILQRRPEYHAYVRQTNAFFPGPPRKGL